MNSLFPQQAIDSSLKSAATIPSLVQQEDKNQGTSAEVIDLIKTKYGEIQVVWREITRINIEIDGVKITAGDFEEHNNVSLAEISLFLNGERIGCIIAESNGRSFAYKNPTYFGYYILQVLLLKKYRGLGLGSAMYIYLARMLAITFNSPLRSNEHSSESALKVWSLLSSLNLSVTEVKETYEIGNNNSLTVREIDMRTM